MKIIFEPSRIEVIIFDMDGTLYQKGIEHIAGSGQIKTIHDFFRYLAFDRLKNTHDLPEKISATLIHEYKTRAKDQTLVDAIRNVSERTRNRLDQLVKQYGSNGRVFSGEFQVHTTFLHHMVENIDFDSVLVQDKELQGMIKYLKAKYKLGILTTDTFSTLTKVTKALGLNLEDFYMNTSDHYPVLCAENVRQKKPSLDGFRRIAKIYPVDDTRKIAYIGDHFEKDIKTSLRCGFQAIHVTPGNSGVKEAAIGNTKFEYARIENIYALQTLLNR
jgi:FMN phosphatase YigB (HAD superfamily)